MSLLCGNDSNIFLKCRRLGNNAVTGYEKLCANHLSKLRADFISITDCGNFTQFTHKYGYNKLLMRPNNPSINRINKLAGVS